MGSERLSHAFTAEDPTFDKDKSAYANETSSKSSHSLSHTSGTHPISVSNGPPHSSGSKHIRKTNSKYRKLIKLYERQLSHISSTLDAIETLAKPGNPHQDTVILLNKQRVNKLKEKLEDFSNDPSKQDYKHFEPLKDDIDQLIDDLKSYKMDNDNPNATHTMDSLVGIPLDVSDSEHDEEKTLIYT